MVKGEWIMKVLKGVEISDFNVGVGVQKIAYRV